MSNRTIPESLRGAPPVEKTRRQRAAKVMKPQYEAFETAIDLNTLINYSDRSAKFMEARYGLLFASVSGELMSSKVRPPEGREVPASIRDLFAYKHSNNNLQRACVRANCPKSGTKRAMCIRLFTRWLMGTHVDRIARVWRGWIAWRKTVIGPAAVTIQRIMRGWFIRRQHERTQWMLFPSRRGRCVNDCDVVTMEDLADIPAADFAYIHCDSEGGTHRGHRRFHYGYHIDSLGELVRRRIGRPMNVCDRAYYRWLSDSRRGMTVLNPWTRAKMIVQHVYTQLRAQRRAKERLGLIPSRLTRSTMYAERSAARERGRGRERGRALRGREGGAEPVDSAEVEAIPVAPAPVFQLSLLQESSFSRDQLGAIRAARTPEQADAVLHQMRANIVRTISMLGYEFRMAWLETLPRLDTAMATWPVMFTAHLNIVWTQRLGMGMSQDVRALFFPSFHNADPFSIIRGCSTLNLSPMMDLNLYTRHLAMLQIIVKFLTDSEDPDLNAQGAMYVVACMSHFNHDAREAHRWLYEAAHQGGR